MEDERPPPFTLTAGVAVTVPQVDGDAGLGRIDRIVGCGPSEVVHPRAFPVSTWALEEKRRPASNFDEAFAPLLDRLWPHGAAPGVFWKEAGATVSAHLRPHAEPSEILYVFEDPNTLRRLADLNAELHLHPYDVGPGY